jgi:acyl-coenzyme A synthetase/AMP-(fatty) acid ligase
VLAVLFNQTKSVSSSSTPSLAAAAAASTTPLSSNKLSYANPAPPDGFKLIDDTIDQRIAHMAVHKPDQVAYKFAQTDVELTYRELKQRVDEVAQSLLRIGFTRGDTLAIMLPNSPEFVLTVLAAASIGVIAMMLNPTFNQFELEIMMRKNECKGVVILDSFKSFNHYEVMRNICPELAFTRGGDELSAKKLPHLKHVIVVDNVLIARKNAAQVYPGTTGFSQLERHDSIKLELPLVEKNDVFALLFTVCFRKANGKSKQKSRKTKQKNKSYYF